MKGRAQTRLRVEIESLATGGDGVAHVEVAGESRAVFVPGTAPGDVVDAEIDLATRPARGRLVAMVRASPSRREPPCPYVEACGGCALMHLTAEARVEARRALVASTVLRALGDEMLPVVDHPAPRDERYRTRARVAVSTKRRLTVGFRGRASRTVVPIDSCLVLDERLDPVLAILGGVLAGSRGEGEASVALGKDARPVLALAWDGELAPEAFARVERAVSGGSLSGASLLLRDARAPAVIGDPTVLTPGPDGLPLEIPPGSFAQANPDVSAALVAHVAGVARTAGKSVVELYAGAGNLGVVLAREARAYVAVESSEPAVAAAKRNLAARGLSIRYVVGDAAAFPFPPDVDLVVLDPPRAGAAEVAARLGASKVREVVYVSCDPATLARDAKMLVAAGFSARSLHTFDMFPQTSHVETVLHLVRAPKAKPR